MAVNYASGLSEYQHKGVCGRPEVFDDDGKVAEKVKILAQFIREAKHCVLYVGAGLSTSAGIPDFRGPNGVWTLEKKGEKLPENKLKTFDKCIPSVAHRAIRALVEREMVKFIVSQNIDGLFVKDGISRSNLAELHGNYFVDECELCHRRYIRNRPSPTMGSKRSDTTCPRRRPCRGWLQDTILDWEQNLPESELLAAEEHSNSSDLSICLGTTLQIEPAGSLPLRVKRKSNKRKLQTDKTTFEDKVFKTDDDFVKKEEIQHQTTTEVQPNRRLVIVNLQKTRHDNKADLVIHHFLDDVFVRLCAELGVIIPDYRPELDPTRPDGPDLIEFTNKSTK